MIRIPNRGVVAAGAALSSVSLVVGALGGSPAAAAPAAPRPASPATVPAAAAPVTAVVSPPARASWVSSAAVPLAVPGSRAWLVESRAISAHAAADAVAAVAGASATAKPRPKPKPAPKPKPKVRHIVRRAPLTPRETARTLVLAHPGWKAAQFGCLDLLWTRESGWDPHNENGDSGAYGIPQSLPGHKMASFGSDWRDNPSTQIRWGLWYIADRYGTPCAAWAHSERYDYY